MVQARPIQGNGRHFGTSRRRRCTFVLASLFTLSTLLLTKLLSAALHGGHAVAWSFAASPHTGPFGEPKVRSNAAARAEVDPHSPGDGGGAVERRSILLAGAGVAAVVAPPASAEEAVQRSATTTKIQRVIVNVGNDEAMEKEVKFWTEACEMKVFSDRIAADGNREVNLGFIPEDQTGGFALQLKEDPAVLKRPSPRLLNYDVMQPTVNALNYVQIGATGKVVDIFNRVQNAGGASLFGDFAYLDAESPRGVAVRMVPRDVSPTVEFVSFNVEVPAFEAVSLFYKRSIGMRELKYNESDPPVQKLSALLASDLSGPKLLLTPVPDRRLKDRELDEFEGLLCLSPDVPGVAKAAEVAIELNEKEERGREEKIKQERKQAKATGREGPSLKAFLEGTKAQPDVQVVGKTARLNDGVGNILFITDQSDFQRVA